MEFEWMGKSNGARKVTNNLIDVVINPRHDKCGTVLSFSLSKRAARMISKTGFVMVANPKEKPNRIYFKESDNGGLTITGSQVANSNRLYIRCLALGYMADGKDNFGGEFMLKYDGDENLHFIDLNSKL